MAAKESTNHAINQDALGGARYDPDRHGYRIYVGNLPSCTKHEDMVGLFLPFGPIVDIWLASNPPGFGFVVFKNAYDAEQAVIGKNCTIFHGAIIRVQHARLFKDRFIKPYHKGRSPDATAIPESLKSSPRSRSRSRSRSARSWSGSSSRHSYFSKIYGESRTGSRSPLKPKSESSSTSHMTSHTEESSSLSKSRSRSRSRSAKRRGRNDHKGRASSNRRRRHHHHRNHRHRSKRRRRRRRSSLQTQRCSRSSTVQKESTSNCSHSASTSPQPERAASRSKAKNSTHRAKHRHCRRCTDGSPTSSSCSVTSKSQSSVADGKDLLRNTKKCYRKRKRKRKRSRQHRRESSSSLSSSSVSSSSSSSLLSVPDRRGDSSSDAGKRRKLRQKP